MAKKKLTGYGREVSTSPPDSTNHVWTVGGLLFSWVAGSRGVNLSVDLGDGSVRGLAYAGMLKEAGYVAEGFAAGYAVGLGLTRVTKGEQAEGADQLPAAPAPDGDGK